MIENLMTYLWILVFVFAVVLTIIGILRWIAGTGNRKGRLTIISICAFVVLVILILFDSWEAISEVLEKSSDMSSLATTLLIDISKTAIKVSMIVLIVAFSLIIAFVAVLLAVHSGKALFYTFSSNGGQKTQNLQDEAEKIKGLLKNPVFIVTIAGGILSIFLVLPIVMGGYSSSLAECWLSGVENITQLCSDDGEGKFVYNLSMYALMFILILGIGYGVTNILFEIIRERFKKKTFFLSEYSNSIGLLAVGISILLIISSNDEFASVKHFVDYSKPFVLVIFVIAMGIFTLEIIRLLIDMKEKIIRKEARYVFVLLVGLCTVIIMKAFSIFYDTISSILGRKNMQLNRAEKHIQKIQDTILEKVAEDMKEGINNGADAGGEVPYKSFKGMTTKK